MIHSTCNGPYRLSFGLDSLFLAVTPYKPPTINATTFVESALSSSAAAVAPEGLRGTSMDTELYTKLTIYKAARSIKRRDNTLYNALRSIYEDSTFVGEISQLWAELPLLANLRCGLWYYPKFEATCYFKSTDGHANNWSFSTSRLNLHVAQLAGQKGGCIIVDSTRRGKRFPDSMSKTIPIWTCVLNRAILNHIERNRSNGSLEMGSSSSCHQHSECSGLLLCDWDSSLHLPLWVSETEKAAIEDRLEEWTKQLEACGADIASLVSCLRKPLRPLWISQKTVIWLNEVPGLDSWDFTPIILVSASSSVGISPHKTTSEFSWNYIPGAGDDEESWARGLSPHHFWKQAYDLISSGPNVCNQKVADIVERDRVYHALREQTAHQVSVKPAELANACLFNAEPPLSLDIHDSKTDMRYSGSNCKVSWLGSTNVAVGTSQLAAACVSDFDCILNCDQESVSIFLPTAEAYLHLPMVNSKMDRFSLTKNLPSAVDFAKLNLGKGKKLLVCCRDGEDISVCVCLAILASLFDDEGTFDDGKCFSTRKITKWEMRRRLVYVCKFATSARPSRGNLKQVFSFLSGGRVG